MLCSPSIKVLQEKPLERLFWPRQNQREKEGKNMSDDKNSNKNPMEKGDKYITLHLGDIKLSDLISAVLQKKRRSASTAACRLRDANVGGTMARIENPTLARARARLTELHRAEAHTYD